MKTIQARKATISTTLALAMFAALNLTGCASMNSDALLNTVGPAAGAALGAWGGNELSGGKGWGSAAGAAVGAAAGGLAQNAIRPTTNNPLINKGTPTASAQAQVIQGTDGGYYMQLFDPQTNQVRMVRVAQAPNGQWVPVQ